MSKHEKIAALRAALKSFAKPTDTHFEAIYVGNKTKGGQDTGEQAICFLVKEKRPLDEVPENERVPSLICSHITDVVEGYQDIALEAWQPDPTTVCPGDTDAAAHQTLAGCVKGGISIGPRSGCLKRVCLRKYGVGPVIYRGHLRFYLCR